MTAHTDPSFTEFVDGAAADLTVLASAVALASAFHPAAADRLRAAQRRACVAVETVRARIDDGTADGEDVSRAWTAVHTLRDLVS